jgi:16S rRNA (guanine527-N7)-methyltransferase
VESALDGLACRFDLSASARLRLGRLLRMICEDPWAPVGTREPLEVLHHHLADSLVALQLQPTRSSATVVDLGSGAGFPGLPLAIARPDACFSLVESSARKCAFLERAAAACGVANVSVVNARAEAWPAGLGRFDLATARAVAALDAVIEYAAPLLRVGGWLLVWRGRRSDSAERYAKRAAAALGMEHRAVVRTNPFPDARDRHLHLVLKVRQTPPGFPRRPGMAIKRPVGRRKAGASIPGGGDLP